MPGRKIALIGALLGHSYSPEIHALLGDYEYRLHGKTAAQQTVFGEATVQQRGDQVRLLAHFDQPGAVIAFFEA